MDGKDFHLAEEIRYIQRRAAEHDGRFVTIGSLALFSTETGDAWLLDPSDHLAARLAQDGDPEEIYFEETDTSFAIGWKGNYRRRRIRVYRQGLTPYRHHPWLSHPPYRGMGLIWKFQICLASIC
jgi:hypothetical protein